MFKQRSVRHDQDPIHQSASKARHKKAKSCKAGTMCISCIAVYFSDVYFLRTKMEALYMLSMLTLFNVTIISLMVFVARPVHYLKQWAKMLGIGYLVWHSDSNKYFYTLTYKDALEWLGATYASAAIFRNWDKEALAVKLV